MAESDAARRAREAREMSNAAIFGTPKQATEGARIQEINRSARRDAIRRLRHELDDLQERHDRWVHYVSGLSGGGDAEDEATIAGLAEDIADRQDVLRRVEAWDPDTRRGEPYTSGKDVIQGIEHVRQVERKHPPRAAAAAPAVPASTVMGPPAPVENGNVSPYAPGRAPGQQQAARTNTSAGGPAVSDRATPVPASGSGSGSGQPAAVGAANPDGLFGIPGGAEIWKTSTGWFAVYRVPTTGTPLAWRIEGDNDLAAIFGSGRPGGKAPVAQRTLTDEEWKRLGVLQQGSSRMLRNLSEHPFDAFVTAFETEAKVQPWIRDPEIMAITVRAMLEGRMPTESEWAGTDWWKTHTDPERKWMRLVNLDPATARQQVQDQRDTVRRLLLGKGLVDPPEVLVTWVADRITGGTWSQAYGLGQIQKLVDPSAPGQLDEAIKPLLANLSLNTLADNTSKGEQLIRTWIGPAFANGWTKGMKEEWAGRLRNDPVSGEEELIRELRGQRKVLYPEYTDDTQSYDTIAAPWRGVVRNTWGQDLDESDPLFQRIVRMGGQLGTEKEPGGLDGVQQLLRREGLKRGNGTVTNNALSTIGEAFGGGVRGVA